MYITGKKAQQLVNKYLRTPLRNIYDCYNHPSPSKVEAWVRCLRKRDEMCGCNISVISFNKCYFTVAWCYICPESLKLMLHVETYANSYDMEM